MHLCQHVTRRLRFVDEISVAVVAPRRVAWNVLAEKGFFGLFICTLLLSQLLVCFRRLVDRQLIWVKEATVADKTEEKRRTMLINTRHVARS